MNRLASLACVVLLAACSEAPKDGDQAAADADAWLTRELGWVEGADAVHMAADDHARQSYRFLSVCALGCETAGVSDLMVRMCFPGVAVVVADKTTEAVQSERHAALKKQARAFAETYNRRTAEYLKAAGVGECPPPVDWDKATTEITAVLDRAYSGGFRGDVAVNPARRVFQIRLPRGAAREAMGKPLCEILARNGLADRAGLEVKGVDAQEDYGPIAC